MFKSALLSIVLLESVVAMASALECYQCESDRTGQCGDEFDEDSRPATCNDGGICLTTITKYIGRLTRRQSFVCIHYFYREFIFKLKSILM